MLHAVLTWPAHLLRETFARHGREGYRCRFSEVLNPFVQEADLLLFMKLHRRHGHLQNFDSYGGLKLRLVGEDARHGSVARNATFSLAGDDACDEDADDVAG